jgi:formylglycine-generating enzyme required for sulfatase activity
MLGNVREWVEDCYVNGYSDAPADGSPVLTGDCGRRVVRGGSVKSGQAEHRAANRARISVSTRDRQIGFRVVMEED